MAAEFVVAEDVFEDMFGRLVRVFGELGGCFHKGESSGYCACVSVNGFHLSTDVLRCLSHLMFGGIFMRGLMFCVFVFSLGLNSQAYAGKEDAIEAIKGISVNGLSMSSTLDELDAYFAQFGSKVNCAMTGLLSLRDYTWDCTYQDDPSQMPQWRYNIRYIHDRVVALDYNGPSSPLLGGMEASAFISGLDERLKNNPDVQYDYQYSEYGEHVEATEHALAQSLDVKVYKVCAMRNGRETDYTIEGSVNYSYMPSSKAKKVSVSLKDGYYMRCKKTLKERLGL